MTPAKFLVEPRMALVLQSKSFASYQCWKSGNYLSEPSFSDCREECSNKGGTSSGSCASGFGVCCISKLEFAGFLLAEIGNLHAVEQFQLQLVVVDQHLTTAPTLRYPTPIFTLALVEQQFARPAQAFAK